MTAQARKRLSAISLVAGLAIVALVAFYFVRSAQAEDTAKAEKAVETVTEPVPVRTAPVTEGRISSYISATANLVAENEVVVLAEGEGRVDELRVEEGDRVAKGQVLAALARADREIAVQKAQARAKTVRLQHDRGQRLVAEELLSPEEFEKLALEKELAEQELAEAEWQLEKTLVRSPFSGVVTLRQAQLGQHVRPGDELFTVTDFEPLVARVYLPEKDVLTLDVGRRAELRLKADTTFDVEGRIRQISPVVDTATGTVKVTVEAVAPPAAVRPGAFVEVFVVRDTHAAALLVPREAVVRELQKAYVFVAGDTQATKRAVTLGLEENGLVEAISGLAAGEQVIVAGQGALEDGAPIRQLHSDDAAGAQRASDDVAR